MLTKNVLYYFYDLAYVNHDSRVFTQLRATDLTNHDIGIICRRVCEYYLRWTPTEAVINFTTEVQERMYVDGLIRRIRLPKYYSPSERLLYLYQLMYPEHFEHIDRRTSAISLYKMVLSGKLKAFPHAFLSGSRAADLNAYYCLIHALQTYGRCQTEENARYFMSGERAIPFLRAVKLYDLYQRKYHHPSAFLGDALRQVGWE